MKSIDVRSELALRVSKRRLVAGVTFLTCCSVLSGALPSQAEPVRYFTWTYKFEPNPGQRKWTLDSRNRWHEVYPDGHEAKLFDVVARGTVNGCGGSLASSSDESFFDVFVPDTGCQNMWALFRRNNGKWLPMGQMVDVR